MEIKETGKKIIRKKTNENREILVFGTIFFYVTNDQVLFIAALTSS